MPNNTLTMKAKDRNKIRYVNINCSDVKRVGAPDRVKKKILLTLRLCEGSPHQPEKEIMLRKTFKMKRE